MGVERRRRDAEAVGDFGDGQVAILQQRAGDSEIIGVEGLGTAADAATGAGGIEPGGGALADDAAFEFGQAPKIWNTSRPPEVVVSIASFSDRKPMPRADRSSTVSISCFSERARRSSFHTTSVSPVRMNDSAGRLKLVA